MTIYKQESCKERLKIPNYKFIRELGKGEFGEVCEYVNINNDKHVAIKTATKQETQSSLENERKILKILESNGGTAGVPKLLDERKEDGCNFIVTELLGPELLKKLQECGGTFSLKTTLMLAIYGIELFERIHDKGIIHRDIKPDNFMLGLDQTMLPLNIADFGLSKQYRHSNTREHIPKNKNYHFVGNMLFCSINAHLNKEQSRRDDLISFGYMLIYFLRGTLPWSRIKCKEDEINYKVCQCKLNTPTKILCEGCPHEFIKYMKYVRKLRFDKKPDYNKLKKLFIDLFIDKEYKFDNQFDWVIKENNERQQAREQQEERQPQLRNQEEQEMPQTQQEEVEEEIRTINNFDSDIESVSSDSSTQEQLYDCTSSIEDHAIRHCDLN